MRAPVEGWFDELERRLADVVLDGPEPAGTACIGLELTGQPGAGWVLRVEKGRARLTHLDPRQPAGLEGEAPGVTLVVRDDLVAQLVSGQLGVAQALAEGGIRIRGDAAELFAAEPVLAAVQRVLHETSESAPPAPSSTAEPEGDTPRHAGDEEPGSAGSGLR